MLIYQILAYTTYGKILKSNIRTINLKYQLIFKTGYYLELLTPETMKLLVSTKTKKTENECSSLRNY